MATTIYTRYDEMTANQREGFDWFSDEVENEIATMALRYSVDSDEIHRSLEQYIPDADTPASSIARAALSVADRYS